MSRFISKIDLAPLCKSESKCMQFLYDEGLLRTRMLCPECDARLHPITKWDRTFQLFSCRKGHPQFSQSVAKGTWFEKTKLSPAQVLLITHCFAHKSSYALTVTECSFGDQQLSERTVADWFSYCREVCMISMETKYTNRGKIGGPGHVVQIDECKIGRRKFHRGRVVEGNWVLGMIDVVTNEVRMTICPGNNRDAATLYGLIEQHVELGSTIHTDCWRGYNGLLGGGFAAHLTVNHSVNFVDPVTNVHTNNIESRWRALRHRLSRGGIRRNQIDVHLAEHLWRQDCENRAADPFQEMIEDIRLVYPVV